MKTGTEKEHTHTQTHRPRDAKTSHLSIVNDSLKAVMSHSESTCNPGSAGVVCWQEPQQLGCQSMCQEKMLSLINLAGLGHKNSGLDAADESIKCSYLSGSS